MRLGDWSSPGFLRDGIIVIPSVGTVWGGGGRAVWDGPGVATLWAGRVLALVSRTSMMKYTVAAGGVSMGASDMDLSESVAVGALGVAVSLRHFLDLAPL